MRNEVGLSFILNALIDGIVSSGTDLVIDGSFFYELRDYVEKDTIDSKSPEDLAYEAVRLSGTRLLDFGCGTGGHRAFLESLGFDWTGLNYRDGMAPLAAEHAAGLNDDRIRFYDGLHIPFDDNSFDVVYSFQTFEHIQDINVTFSEICRVLKPGGRLIGAVSYLEQVHDFSTFNFTPYGFKISVLRAGLELKKVYPRADVFSFLLRRLLVVTSASDDNSLSMQLGADNFVHRKLGDYVSGRADITSANLVRLMFSTHFSFLVEKPIDLG